MRMLTLILVVLIAALQYPLWLGKGSWLRVWDLNRQIEKQKDSNTALKVRNDAMDAEVRDLKQGYAAIEERARSELGMIKQDEVFYQVMEKSPELKPNPATAAQGLPSAQAGKQAMPAPTAADASKR
jgi:cell division protein FtsB